MTLTTFGWTQLQLDDEERRLRQSAQHDVLFYTRLLEELALQLAPEQVEQCKRHNPAYFLQLDAPGWQRFFHTLPNRTVQVNGWGIQTLEIDKTITLQRRVAELTDANRHLTEVVAAFQQELRDQQTNHGGDSSQANSDDMCPVFTLPDRPPSQFVDRFNNWRREGLTLALLATTGWSLRHAIAQELARRLNITANAGSLKRLFAQVEKAGLWRMQTIEVSQSRIVLVTLTELGKQVMQASHIPAGGQRLLFGLQRLAAQPTLVLVEGELNAVSLWQSCRDLGVDVLSWGPQGNLLWPPVTQLAMQMMQPYQQVLLWADEIEMVHKLHTHLLHTGVTLPTILTTDSPLGQDANDLLLRGELRDYVQQVLRL